MARINDLERGFEKTLAYAYGKHVVQGHLIMHNIDIFGTDKQVTLLMALGDGAYNNLGEGAWGISYEAAPAEPSDITFVNKVTNVDGATFDVGAIEPPVGVATNDWLWVHTYTSDSVARIPTTPDGWEKFDEVEIPYESGVEVLSVFGKFYNAGDTLPYQFVPSIAPSYMDVFLSVWRGVSTLNPVDAVSIYGVETDATGPTNIPLPSLTTSSDNETLVATGIWYQADVGIPAGFTSDYDGGLLSISHKLQAVAGSSGDVDVPLTGVTTNDTGGGTLAAFNRSEGGGLTATDPVVAVYYAGRLIDPANWHYHPGLFSTGPDDPIQGVDTFFPEGLTYSGTAYIAIRLPIGIAEDADPSKVAIILTTSCIADYDIDGNLTKIDYSANPARIKADMLKRRGLVSRLNWDSYIQARDWYDELIPWSAGDVVNDYVDFSDVPTWKISGNVDTGSGGSLAKNTASTGYDNTSITTERIVAGQDGSLEITVSGAFPTFTGGGSVYLVDGNGKAWFGISWGNGHYSFFANGIAIDDPTEPYDYPAVAGDRFKLTSEGGEFKFYQNDVQKNPPKGSSLVPLDTDLYGKVQLYQAGAGVSASFFEGQTVVNSTLTVSEIPRFEAHPAFTAPVDLTTALDFVDSLCASDTQDAGDEIIFLTPATPFPRQSIFTFTEDENVVEDSLRVYRRDIRERPNRLSAQFRNLNRVYLDQDEVFDSRDTLFDEVGYTIDPGALNFASMNASQAQRLIKYNMRRMSDNDTFCELTGMADSFKLLPGDIVTVISDKLPDNAPKDFIILTASRASGEQTAYERSFTMQEWFASDYSDNDHGAEAGVVAQPIPSSYDPPDAPVVVIDD